MNLNVSRSLIYTKSISLFIWLETIKILGHSTLATVASATMGTHVATTAALTAVHQISMIIFTSVVLGYDISHLVVLFDYTSCYSYQYND